MEQEFVSYEQAVVLKELGFDEECFSFFEDVDVLYNSEGTYKYNDNVWEESEVIAPLKQQVFRWFRDKYDFLVIIRDIEIIASDKSGYRWKWIIFRLTDDIYIAEDKSLLGSLTYEEAESTCIDKLIELAKQQVS